MSGNENSDEGLRELGGGVLHWSAPHPGIGQVVHSVYIPGNRTVIDPIAADSIANALEERGGVERIVLSNRHHRRGSFALAERFGATITAPASGMHEFGPDTAIEPYDWNRQPAPGITAHEVGVICPDDGALHIAAGSQTGAETGALAIADSVIRWDGRLAFVPDFLMDDPEETKAGTLKALEPLLDLDFEILLLAHGDPSASGGKDELAAFIENPHQADFGG